MRWGVGVGVGGFRWNRMVEGQGVGGMRSSLRRTGGSTPLVVE